MSRRRPAELDAHLTRVASIGCVICYRPAEIAHAHGPSLTERGFMKPKGKKQLWQDWLVLPICPSHHRSSEHCALDLNLPAWEARYGSCADWLDLLCVKLGYDVWAHARDYMRSPVMIEWKTGDDEPTIEELS